MVARTAEEFSTLSKQLSSVVGSSPSKGLDSSSDSKDVSWQLTTPSPLNGLRPRLILSIQENSAKSGITEVGFFVDKGKGGNPTSPFGKIVFVPIS